MDTLPDEAAVLDALRTVDDPEAGMNIVELGLVYGVRPGEGRIDIEMTRLLCLKAADMMDKVGNKVAQLEIAMIKVQAPRMALKILDQAVQAHGGAGVASDFGLAASWASLRTLRLADGPDEVHCRAIARMEFGRYRSK